jgi:hypothetical protein
MAPRNGKIKKENSSSPSSESSDDSSPPPPPKKQRQQLLIKKPKPEVLSITSSSETDSDSEEVHQQIKNNHGTNNGKVSHANVGKNTTAAATNSSTKALVRALYEVGRKFQHFCIAKYSFLLFFTRIEELDENLKIF